MLIESVNRFIESKKNEPLEKENKKLQNDKFKNENKELGKEEEIQFWKNIGKVLEPEKIQVLEALDKFSRIYYNLLRERKRTAIENANLQKQNIELKKMTNEYDE